MIRFFIIMCYVILISELYYIYRDLPDISDEELKQHGQILIFIISIYIILKVIPFWTEVLGNKLGDKIVDKYNIGKKDNRKEK